MTWLYVLRLHPRLHAEASWMEADKATVASHFQYLSAATEAGQVVLAGRTSEPHERTFGLVIFEAPDEVAARAFMQADPAVAGGVMSATLHPYSIALRRK